MALPSRAAAVRGDDYQYAIGWVWACSALCEPEIVFISIEDVEGGAFDDIVIRRRDSLTTTWLQVKTSNSGSGVVDEAWLTTPATPNGRSPLQRFFATWQQLVSAGNSFELALITNRQYDHKDPLLGPGRDLESEMIRVPALMAATPRSALGKARDRWRDALDTSLDQLEAFLTDMRFQTSEAKSSWGNRAKPLMRQAGLRDDDQAVIVGQALVRGWVTSGAGPQSRDEIRRQVADGGLLAREGTLVFAVHAIDTTPTAQLPNVEIDIVELYEGSDAFSRRRLRNNADWVGEVQPKVANAVTQLQAFGTRRVHVIGDLRLPLWFGIGRALPDVGRWTVSLHQHDELWSTADTQEPATVRVLAEDEFGDEPVLALGVALTHDVTEQVRQSLQDDGFTGQLLVLGPEKTPDKYSVRGGGWALDWVHQAQALARQRVAAARATRLRLYLSSPAGVALFMGHFWNLMPPTTVFEFIPPATYEPTLVLPG